MSQRILLVFLVVAASAYSTADAGAVISFGPPIPQITLPQSGSIQIPITVSIAANVGTQVFDRYELPLDLFEPTGSGLPFGWTVGGATQLFFFPDGSFFQSELNPSEGDLRVGDVTLGNAVTLTTDPIDLFRFDLTVSSAASPGQISVGVFDGVLLSVSGLARSDINIESLVTINVAAIPEPILTPLLAVAGLITLRHQSRSRRHRDTASV